MKQKNNKNLNSSHEELSKKVVAARDESEKEVKPMGENRTDKTYKELSAEFRELFPKVIAAYQLIRKMYDDMPLYKMYRRYQLCRSVE
jgi:predicted  nucleic acid-binding Zn-ribbon protein